MAEYVDKYHHSTTDTTSDRLTCPYCDHEWHYMGDWPGEDQVFEQECPSCEKAFGLTVVVTHRYICMPEV